MSGHKGSSSNKSVGKQAAAAAASSSSSGRTPSVKGPVDSPFVYITTSMRLSVPPFFSSTQGGGVRGGAEELLDSMVMR